MSRITLKHKKTGVFHAITVPNREAFIFRFGIATAFNGPLYQFGIKNPNDYILS